MAGSSTAVEGRGGDVHVLVLPSWYPTAVAPVAGIFFREQAGALRRAGFRVGVVYPDLRSLRRLGAGGWWRNRFQITCAEEDGIPTCRCHGWAVPRARRLTGRTWVTCALRLVERYVATVGVPDLVHAHSIRWAGIAALTVRQRLGIPYVLTEHASAYARGNIRARERPLITEAFREAAVVSAVSPAMADALRPYSAGRTIAVTPNLVDTTFFALPPRERTAPPFRFLTVGGLTGTKGIDVLLHAFAEAFRDRPDVHLEIGGDGPLRGSLERLADRAGVRDQIRFLGALNRGQVRDAMWRAQAFVLASPWESFGIVLGEAMATGLEVIATSGSGPDSFVTSKVGRLVPPGRVDALAAALKDRTAQGVAGRAREETVRAYVEHRFGEAAFVRNVGRSYRAALAEGRDRAA